jgi:putative DNA methylase
VTYKKKLIEVALPLVAISDASSTEKGLKNSHPANLHQWWARRPLAAARAVIWASLVDDPSAHPQQFPSLGEQETERDRLFGILESLMKWDSLNDTEMLATARLEIEKSCGEVPTILDPFGGGGAIPIEALRLGLGAVTGDLNPLPVLIQRFMLQFIPRFSNTSPVNLQAQSAFMPASQNLGIASDVSHYGEVLCQGVRDRVQGLYPPTQMNDGSEVTPIAWIWARTVQSPDPSWPGHVPLVKSWILSKKNGRPVVHVVPEVDHSKHEINYRIQVGGTPSDPTISRGNGQCIATGAPIPASYIREQASDGKLREDLIAIAVEGIRRREYLPPNESHREAPERANPSWEPTGPMSDHPQYMGTPRYGLDEWAKLYSRRQLAVLTEFVDLLPNVQAKILEDASGKGFPDDKRSLVDGGLGARAYSEGITMALAFAIDKLADLNNTLVRWESVAECPRAVFGRQAIQMTWDYAESNPFSSSSGSFDVVVNGICRAITGPGLCLPAGNEADVKQLDAKARVTESCDYVLCTDPPYYASVPYSDISDFFYVWLRKSLGGIFRDETSTLVTPKADELVADQKRHGTAENADKFFEMGMQAVFEGVSKHQHPDYPATIFYAIKGTESDESSRSSTGWASFLSALVGAGMMITATWPIRTENKSRLRAMNSNALASSIVLVCRPRPLDAKISTRRDFVSELRSELPEVLRVMQRQNIAPVDFAQSAIGPGIAIFSRNARVIEADGEAMSIVAALSLINGVLSEVLSGEESEFDSDTRFALTWFEQFGHNPGPAGDAITLATAKNTSVDGVATSGIASSRDGKFRLLDRNELDQSWDPATDSRLTVWEATQHLIRALDDSETAAADLLRRIGQGFGERARQLAYLLYGICDRNKWAQEAGAYNMLVTAWPEIERLSDSVQVDGSADDELQLF